MPFNLSPMEMLFVMVVLLLLFGSKRLPELGSGLGKGIREFKRTIRDVNTEITAPEPPPNQFHAPAQPWQQVPATAQQPMAAQQAPAQPVAAPVQAAAPVQQPTERKPTDS
ncbi:MAG TPA: twin-arginine translocase TatA/TatE family subunit [Longimicrobiales bacterium]|nr:twin-arginine translocase TatA/TatE family subunit [Longimicrobiales bacterium]